MEIKKIVLGNVVFESETLKSLKELNDLVCHD